VALRPRLSPGVPFNRMLRLGDDTLRSGKQLVKQGSTGQLILSPSENEGRDLSRESIGLVEVHEMSAVLILDKPSAG
jgi:hypothetical protein